MKPQPLDYPDSLRHWRVWKPYVIGLVFAWGTMGLLILLMLPWRCNSSPVHRLFCRWL